MHGDVAMIGENRFHLVEQFLPAGILALASGQGVEVAGFDLVNQFCRLATGRNQVEPTPSDHQIRGQAEHAVSNRIAMMVIVKEPGVDIAFAERCLYGGKIHGQITILNKARVLGESGENG